MHDSYLLLTPVLMLLVVALVGFVGCDALFGIDHVPDPEPALDPVTGVSLVPRDQAVDVDWSDYPNATAYTVHWGTNPGDHPNSHTLAQGETRPFPVDQLQNGITFYFIVTATVGTKETPDSEEQSTVPGIYGVPTNLIETATFGAPRKFDGQMGIGIVIGAKRIQAIGVRRAVVAGNSQVHRVRIIDKASGMEVAGGDVPTAGVGAGAFAQADVTPGRILDANTTYYILSDESGTGDEFFDASNSLISTTMAVSRQFAAYGDFAGTYVESPVNKQAYGPVDIIYVDLP